MADQSQGGEVGAPPQKMEFASRVDVEVRRFLSEHAPHQRDAIEKLGSEETLWGPVDSLLLLSLVGHLENTFGFKVPPRDFTPENFSSIAAITAYVRAATTDENS